MVNQVDQLDRRGLSQPPMATSLLFILYNTIKCRVQRRLCHLWEEMKMGKCRYITQMAVGVLRCHRNSSIRYDHPVHDHPWLEWGIRVVEVPLE